MSEDVWLTCLTHALSTETEEIMGLLLGDIQVISLQLCIYYLCFSFLGFTVFRFLARLYSLPALSCVCC